MKKIWMLCLVLLPCIASAQGGDKSKVMKEIEIAENILASLLQQEIEVADDVVILGYNGSFGNVEGTYIDDFGALFTIGGNKSFKRISIGDGKISSGYNYNYNLNGIAKLQDRLPYTIYLDSDGRRTRRRGRDRDRDDDKEEVEASNEDIERYDDYEFFKKVSRDFFVDYGYLIKGIKSNEKVLIRYVRNNNVAVVIDGWNQGGGWTNLSDKDWEDESGVYTAMVLKSDIDALQRGNLTEAQFENKIAYTEGEEDVETESKDMKLINSIFSRLYKDDLSGSECISSRSTPKSEYIPDLGLVVNMRMNTRCRGNRGFGSRLELFREGQSGFALIDPEEVEESEDDEDRESADEHYPEFLSTLKENVVEYGSIAKSLKEGEVLVFKVDFSGCRDCKLIPEQLSITAKQATLSAYRQGKLSLEKAVNELSIVE
ncbi:MAG: hypothetical protein KTR30_26830 [Saprospiraceae bacterium]|nr:hypothetical protein [Saprospiraceae bacterium]